MLCILSIIPCKIKLYSLRTGSVPVNILQIMLKPTELGPVCKATCHLLSQMLRNQRSLPSKTTVYSIMTGKSIPTETNALKTDQLINVNTQKHYNITDTGNMYISKQIANHIAGMYQIH